MPRLPQVLLVEDDRSIAAALVQALVGSYNITVAMNGAAALAKIQTDSFDLIVLDLNLPDLHGMTVCEQLRERGTMAPILILSGEDRVLTKIKLLDAGANDYLTKPFSLGELKARLRALGRYQPAAEACLVPVLQAGGIELNRQTYEVNREGVPIKLRRKEFALLACLMENAGTVVRREVLTRSAWSGRDELWTNTLDVHIKYLRDKIDRPFGHALIKTVHGRGYQLEHTTANEAAK